MKRAIIFANGSIHSPEAARGLVRDGDLLIAADGGLRLALSLGLIPQIIIGDMDSATGEEVARAREQGAELELFPRDKDQTDLELALDLAAERGCDFIRVIGALGGRTDQTIANLLLLANPSLAGADMRLDDGVEEAFVIRGHASITGSPGDIVSLLPLEGPAEGVVTEGLRYSLRDEALLPFRTRGISNEMTGTRAEIRVAKGWLLCIHLRR